jgi:hypothetical protein
MRETEGVSDALRIEEVLRRDFRRHKLNPTSVGGGSV